MLAVEPSPVEDTIHKNGKIYGIDKGQPWAEAVAVAINDGTFIGVGGLAKIDDFLTGEWSDRKQTSVVLANSSDSAQRLKK